MPLQNKHEFVSSCDMLWNIPRFSRGRGNERRRVAGASNGFNKRLTLCERIRMFSAMLLTTVHLLCIHGVGIILSHWPQPLPRERISSSNMWYSNKKRQHLFLDIRVSSTNTDTLVASLCQCVETRSTVVFDCCLSHFPTSVSTSTSSVKRLAPSGESLYVANTSHHKQETFLYEYPLNWVLLPTKTAQQNAALP
jgi:hypothetical protein